jgi:hypothetical protein
MGSEKKGVKLEICCGVGTVTNDETGNGTLTTGSLKKDGKFEVCSGVGILTNDGTGSEIGEKLTLWRSRGKGGIKAEEDPTDKYEVGGGKLTASVDKDGKNGGVIVYCKEDARRGHGQ